MDKIAMVKSFIQDTLRVTALRMYRRCAVCPMLLVHLDFEEGVLVTTPMDHDNEAHPGTNYGFYGTHIAEKFVKDYRSAKMLESIIYAVPKDVVDTMPQAAQGVRHLVVGYHVRVDGETVSGEMVLTFLLSPVDMKKHAGRVDEIREEYQQAYFRMCPDEVNDPGMEEKFEKNYWSKMAPRFIETLVVSPWEGPSMKAPWAA